QALCTRSICQKFVELVRPPRNRPTPRRAQCPYACEPVLPLETRVETSDAGTDQLLPMFWRIRMPSLPVQKSHFRRQPSSRVPTRRGKDAGRICCPHNDKTGASNCPDQDSLLP